MKREPISETDDELTALLADPAVELMALLPAIAHALNDASFLAEDLVPDGSNVFAEQGGWSPAQQDRIRAMACEGLARLRDQGTGDQGTGDQSEPATVSDQGLINAGIDWITGGERSGDYQKM